MESPHTTKQLKNAKKLGSKRLYFLLLSVAILFGGIYLLVADATGLEYYKHVDEVTQNLAIWQNKAMQIHGFVRPGSIQKWFDPERQQIRYQFQIENCGKTLTAEFRGLVPDTFQENAEVVLKGKILPQAQGWIVEVKEVLGKCPSKYSQDEAHLKERRERCISESQGKD